jgi:GDPmannose 4,6-dehydratase
LLGDNTKARHALGWEPRTSFTQLVEMMVDVDLALARREHALQTHGTYAVKQAA